jgi:hypothetical protein
MSRQPHGTHARYQVHLRQGDMCDKCRAANRDYMRQYRQRNSAR